MGIVKQAVRPFAVHLLQDNLHANMRATQELLLLHQESSEDSNFPIPFDGGPAKVKILRSWKDR